MDILEAIIRIVIGVVLVLVIMGSSLFGYVAWKAGAKRWGGGLFGICALSIFLLYWIVLSAFIAELPSPL